METIKTKLVDCPALKSFEKDNLDKGKKTSFVVCCQNWIIITGHKT